MSYVVDASVAVKWFVRERDHERAVVFLEEMGNHLEAPELILVEIGNVAWKKVQRGDLERELAMELLRQVESCFTELHPADELIEPALAIALQLSHPIYDCLYLACAQKIGCVLVTDDRRLLKTVAGTPFESSVQLLGDLPRLLS